MRIAERALEIVNEARAPRVRNKKQKELPKEPVFSNKKAQDMFDKMKSGSVIKMARDIELGYPKEGTNSKGKPFYRNTKEDALYCDAAELYMLTYYDGGFHLTKKQVWHLADYYGDADGGYYTNGDNRIELSLEDGIDLLTKFATRSNGFKVVSDKEYLKMATSTQTRWKKASFMGNYD